MAEQFEKDRLIEGMVEIFRALLPPAEVDSETDFFDLGGHSILVGRAVARAREQLGLPVSVRDVFTGRNPRAIVEAVTRRAPLSHR